MTNLTKIDKLSFYSFFTKYSLMEEFGFTSGLVKRIFRKILPKVHDKHTIEYALLNTKTPIQNILDDLDFENLEKSKISNELDLAINALGSKLVAFGLDSDIKAKYVFLNLDFKPFTSLLTILNSKSNNTDQDRIMMVQSIQEIEELVTELRKNKNKIGTNFHLTLITRRILDYAHRLKELIDLKTNIKSKEKWEKLLSNYISYAPLKDSIRHYVKRHSDLVTLEIVEHTAQKGEKYIANNKKEYVQFFYKSLLGGGIIAIFALMKIWLESLNLSQINNALYFSINYALCFIIVKQFGGIIATKQPSMTASTIAKNIDKEDNLRLDSVAAVIDIFKKVFSSQFISIIGNLTMALTLSCIIVLILRLTPFDYVLEGIKSDYLLEKVSPSVALAFYSAIAGVFLALSGLISGYFDNKVVASKIGYRIKNSRLFFKSERFANFLIKKGGGLLGNIILGFFLGSAFLLSYLSPVDIDIRHIAFSSSNVGYSIMSEDIELKVILIALCGVLLIGLVNLIVSFAITLFLALKSRGTNLSMIPTILKKTIIDIIRNPLSYIYNGQR